MSKGFTLIELMVVAVIMGIITAMSIYGFMNLQQDETIINSSNQVAGDFRNAKKRAKELQVQSRVLVTSVTSYQVWYDTNRNGVWDAGDTVTNVTLPAGITFSAANVNVSVTYTWEGVSGQNNTTFTLNLGSRTKQVSVFGITGMVVIQ